MFSDLKTLESKIKSAVGPREKIDAMNDLAWALRDTDIDRGLSLSQEAKALATSGEFSDSPYQKGLADSLRNMGMGEHYRSNYNEAISISLEALAIYKHLASAEGQLQVYGYLAESYDRIGNYPEALYYSLEGIRLGEENELLMGTANILTTAGVIYDKIGDYKKELEMFEKAHEIYKKINDKRGEAVVLNNMAMTFYTSKKYPQALDAGKKSLAITQEHDIDLLGANVLCTIGEIYLAQENHKKAQEYLQRSLEKSKEIDFRYTELHSIFHMAKSFQGQKQNDTALEYFAQALALAEEMEEKQVILNIYQALSKIYKEQNDPERALHYFEKFHTLEREIFNETSSLKIMNLEISHQTEAALKAKAEEAKFRALFDNSPIAIYEQDASGARRIYEDLKAQGVTDFRDYLNEHPEVVQDCFARFKVTNINQAAVDLYEAESKEYYSSKDYVHVLAPESIEAMGNLLADFAEGKQISTIQYPTRTLKGKTLYLETTVVLNPDHKDTWSKFTASTIDITEQKLMEEQLRELTITDSLTEISNRRHFFLMIVSEHHRSVRYQHDLSLVLLDIDHFKKINDNYGHTIGDMVLRDIAQLCQDELRATDLIARYGGEEFAIILPETNAEEARSLIEHLRELVENYAVEYKDKKIKITISAGITQLDLENQTPIEELIDQADKALYISKENGRNQVNVWEVK